jgi:hypothetical protein
VTLDADTQTEEVSLDENSKEHIQEQEQQGEQQPPIDETKEPQQQESLIPKDDTKIVNLDNVAEHLEDQKTDDANIPQHHQEALATVATLLENSQEDSKDAHIIKAVEVQETKEHTANPKTTEQNTDTNEDNADVTTDQPDSEHAEYIPDHHNQITDDTDINDGTGII